jgi:MFS family permease
MGFVQAHFIAHATDLGFGRMLAGSAMGLMGGFSIAGALLMGAVSDKIGRRLPLSFTFGWRGFGYVMLLILHALPHPAMLYTAVLVLGMSWSSTVSLLASTCADRYGRRGMGSVFGTVFGIMSLGHSLGVYYPGLLYHRAGSYSGALLINALVAWLASGLIWALHDWRTAPVPAGHGIAKRPATRP